MENASKALLMAGGVLIALLVIGALLLMFNNLSTYQNTNNQNEKETQIVEFNNQFETYIRKDVRGSDLYSLLNKVADYNSRKTDVTEAKEGQNVKFEPMTIVVELKENGKTNNMEEKFSYDRTLRIFINKTTEYKQEKSTKNILSQLQNSVEQVKEETGATESGLTNLTTGISRLFDINENDEDAKNTAIQLWNKNSNKKVKEYKELEGYKGYIYTYYEYLQFKRAHFDCEDSSVKYTNAGRIKEMKFVFNGKIE